VNDLLDLARIDSDRMPLAYVCANLTAMAQDIAAGFAAIAEERAITLSVRGEDELYADVDRVKFARVLVNLLSNAFKFTRRRAHQLHPRAHPAPASWSACRTTAPACRTR
jgi:signal transduction histidine kinase